MTSGEWWFIGARLLAAYLLVLSGLYAAGVLAAFGIGLPEGSNRLIFAGVPVLQGLIAAVAALWLIRRSRIPPAANSSVSVATGDAFAQALQLLGIFFLDSGAAELLRVLIESYFTGADWQIRSSQVASGVVEAGAGAVLTFTPEQVARRLTQFKGTARY